MAEKKQPVRMCAGCSVHRPKRELVRVVRTPDGQILLDTVGKAAGRGAYVCPAAACLQKARKARRIERALNCAIPDEVYDRMLAQIQEANDAGEAI